MILPCVCIILHFTKRAHVDDFLQSSLWLQVSRFEQMWMWEAKSLAGTIRSVMIRETTRIPVSTSSLLLLPLFGVEQLPPPCTCSLILKNVTTF